jgi:hypothetical protein
MAKLISLGKRDMVLAPLGVRFRERVVPEMGKFSARGIMFAALDRDLIKDGNRLSPFW